MRTKIWLTVFYCYFWTLEKFDIPVRLTLYNLGLHGKKNWLASPLTGDKNLWQPWQQHSTKKNWWYKSGNLRYLCRMGKNTCYFKIFFQLNIRNQTSSLVNRNIDQWCKEYNYVPIIWSRVSQFSALQEIRLLFHHHPCTKYFIQLASLNCSCSRSRISHLTNNRKFSK